jgi:hypothetical protein
VSGSRPKRMRTGRLREEGTSSPGSRKRRVLVARVRRIRAVHMYVQRMDDGASSEHQISSLPPGPPSRRARRHKGGGAIEQHCEWTVPRPTPNASRPRRKKGILIGGSAPATTSLSAGDPANAPLPRNAPQSSAHKRTPTLRDKTAADPPYTGRLLVVRGASAWASGIVRPAALHRGELLRSSLVPTRGRVRARIRKWTACQCIGKRARLRVCVRSCSLASGERNKTIKQPQGR